MGNTCRASARRKSLLDSMQEKARHPAPLDVRGSARHETLQAGRSEVELSKTSVSDGSYKDSVRQPDAFPLYSLFAPPVPKVISLPSIRVYSHLAATQDRGRPRWSPVPTCWANSSTKVRGFRPSKISERRTPKRRCEMKDLHRPRDLHV